jgi:hypothetical protein
LWAKRREGGRGGRALELDRWDTHRREESEVSVLLLWLGTRKYSAQVTAAAVAAEMACSSLGASTTLVAGVCSSSSINGQKLAITSARPVSVRAPSRFLFFFLSYYLSSACWQATTIMGHVSSSCWTRREMFLHSLFVECWW